MFKPEQTDELIKISKEHSIYTQSKWACFCALVSRYENHGQITKTAELPSITPHLYRQH